ncbi:MAG: hypothetical protein VW270_21710 [Candidatus Poseidoniales archaeon]
MIEVDMGGVVVEELAGLKRVEREGDMINLVFEGINGNEVFLTASAMRDGMVWNVKENVNV